MLGFFKGKSKDNIIYSPCKGKVVPITEVSDPTFSEKVLGDGFAVIPSEGKIYAPADGEISMVFDTLCCDNDNQSGNGIIDTYWAGYGNAQGRTIYFTCFRWSASKKG